MEQTMAHSPDSVSNNYSLLMALLIAAALHLVLLLSVTLPTPKTQSFSRDIDVTLIAAPNPQQIPEKTQLLAQDETVKAVQSTTVAGETPPVLPTPTPPIKSAPDVKAIKVPPNKIKPIPVLKPIAQPEPPRAEIKQRPVENPPREQPSPLPVAKPAEKIKPIVLKQTAEKGLPEVKQLADNVVREESPLPIKAKPTKLTAASLQQQISQLGSEIQQRAAVAPQTKSKYVNQVRANKFIATQYLRDWETKVERTGNLNYPEVANKAGFSASLTMEVGISADGSIEFMRITQTSGIPELDEAAKNIVRMGAPYPPLPEALRSELDVLKITRHWKFSDESGFITQ